MKNYQVRTYKEAIEVIEEIGMLPLAKRQGNARAAVRGTK